MKLWGRFEGQVHLFNAILYIFIHMMVFVKTSATVCHIKSLHVVQGHSAYVEYIARSRRVLPTRQPTICVALSP